MFQTILSILMAPRSVSSGAIAGGKQRLQSRQMGDQNLGTLSRWSRPTSVSKKVDVR
jgi:hypothetical protein